MDLNKCLSEFNAVSLDDLQSVRLMNRTDVKFAFNTIKLIPILRKMNAFYDVLDLNNSKIQSYRSLYYDTPERMFFLDHHNKRVNRNKVRFREYIDSELFFLEIKLKNNKGKTIKKRVQVDKISKKLSHTHINYINNTIGSNINLFPQHWINFNRITFVNKERTERVTIDLDLCFSNDTDSGNFGHLVIAEIKQDRAGQTSYFKRLLKKMYISPVRLSKYCMSTIELNPKLKHNRFKRTRLLINKLRKG